MKKVIAIVAIATSLVACGGASTAPAVTDSTAVKTDSVKVDSTIAPAADTTKK
jgi:ABC-type glycerol-3-phosphate transport system substrate-binding protein